MGLGFSVGRDGGFNTLLYAEFKTGRPGEARENLFWVQPRERGKVDRSWKALGCVGVSRSPLSPPECA